MALADDVSNVPNQSVLTDCPIPLIGLSNDLSIPWGANVSAGESITNSGPFHLLPIVIGNENPSVDGSMAVHAICPDVILTGANEGHFMSSIVVFNQSAESFVVGANANLTELDLRFNKGTYFGTSTAGLPTIPFGLNLGGADRWNGSIIFGGSFDANRVQRGEWRQLARHEEYAPATPATFLESGKTYVGTINVTTWAWSTSFGQFGVSPFPESHSVGWTSFNNVTIDFNSDAIIVPLGDYCGRNISFEFLEADNSSSYPQYFPLPANLTDSTSRCQVDATIGQTMVLGKPFFQAAYIMVPDTTGDIWAAPAHQFDLPIAAKTFNSSQWLQEAPYTPSASSSPNGPNIGAIVGGTVGGVVLLLLIGLIGTWIVKRRAHYRSSKRSGRPSLSSTDSRSSMQREVHETKTSKV